MRQSTFASYLLIGQAIYLYYLVGSSAMDSATCRFNTNTRAFSFTEPTQRGSQGSDTAHSRTLIPRSLWSRMS